VNKKKIKKFSKKL